MQRLDVCGGADGSFYDRSFRVVEVQGSTHAFERQQYIGEDDGCIEVEPEDGLERDFCRDIGGLAHLDEGVPLP